MPFIGLSIIVQLALAAHVLKSGRDRYWIYIILIPGIGAALYVFTQVLPDLGQTRTAHQAKNSLLKAIDPQRELRKRKQQLELANTLENKIKLADECLEANLVEDAIELYQKSLTGVGEGDPDIMIKLAHAFFENKQFEKSIKTLEETIEVNPNYNSTDGHLLYARSFEELQRFDEALEEYKVVAQNYPGEEGRVRYGLLLLQQNQVEKAKEVLADSVNRSRLAPKFYQKKEKYWIKLAKSKLQAI